jgi:hypothetical protein
MAISDADLSAIDTTIAATTSRGASVVSAGDKRIEYIDPEKLLDIKRRLAEEENGGIYDTTFAPKAYF